MDTSKILSADLLDLVFDQRNKEYGAYQLRKTYHRRVIKALGVTIIFVAVTFTGVVLANKVNPKEKAEIAIRELTIEAIADDKEPEPIPEPERRIEPPQAATIQHTQYAIVDDNQVEEPPPTVEDIETAIISTETKDGIPPDGSIIIAAIDENKEIIVEKVIKEDEPQWVVDIDAKFDGWVKYLERNLRADVPVDNGAPAGSYTVVIQFIVDVDGSISEIKPLTNHGFGLETEAVRVIKKAGKWQPGILNGRPVKAFRKQPITFRVEEE